MKWRRCGNESKPPNCLACLANGTQTDQRPSQCGMLAIQIASMQRWGPRNLPSLGHPRKHVCLPDFNRESCKANQNAGRLAIQSDAECDRGKL